MQVARCDLGGCDWFFMARLVCCVCKVLKVQCRVGLKDEMQVAGSGLVGSLGR